MAIWKQLADYSRYEVSDDGRIRNTLTGKLLSYNINSNGYLRVSLYSDKARKYKQCLLHRLIAVTFIPNPNKLDTVNHKNGDKLNVSVTNLEWCTRTDNNIHMYKTGLKERKLTNEDVANIKKELEQSEKRIGGILARKYGVSISMISLIKRGKYKHLS